MGALISLAGFVGIIVALVALVKGQVRWAGVTTRKRAWSVLGGSFLVAVLGSALTPPSTTPAVPAAEPVPAATVTVTATVTLTPSPTPTPTPEALAAEPEPTQEAAQSTIVPFAPSHTSQAAAPKTSAPKASAPKTTAPKATQAAAAAPTKAPQPTKTSQKPASASYMNCAAVRAAGKAPILRGQPGYGKHLDRDGDGVGCE